MVLRNTSAGQLSALDWTADGVAADPARSDAPSFGAPVTSDESSLNAPGASAQVGAGGWLSQAMQPPQSEADGWLTLAMQTSTVAEQASLAGTGLVSVYATPPSGASSNSAPGIAGSPIAGTLSLSAPAFDASTEPTAASVPFSVYAIPTTSQNHAG